MDAPGLTVGPAWAWPSSKAIAEAHGGSVSVVNRAGGGAQVTLRLPGRDAVAAYSTWLSSPASESGRRSDKTEEET